MVSFGAADSTLLFFKPMKTRSLALLLLALFFSITSCFKSRIEEDTDHIEKIAFGQFSTTNCFGENCIEIFKLDGTGLHEDLLDQLPQIGVSYAGQYDRKVNAGAQIQVTNFFETTTIPQELLDLPSGQVGSAPSWATNVYFEYKKGSYHRYWILDGSFDGSLPVSIQNFVSQVFNITFAASQG